jgi:regulator of protease activity HflC (stomatin/prohibitin superfamily)
MEILLFFILIFILFILIKATFFTVHQQTNVVIELFGKFQRVAGPGLNLKIPFFERIAGKMNLRVQQLDVDIETKTKDNVFVQTVVSIQYMVVPNKVYDAFYQLSDAQMQIRSFVFDVVRAEVPKIILDDVFERKDDIANAVKQELSEVMNQFGYVIVKALVTDINPDSKVKASMNEINAAQRMRMAAMEKGEADKILKVKAAEADAASKALSGKGIADQRKEIINGLRDSVDEFQKSIPGTSPNDVMNLVLMTQYFDTIKEIGTSPNKGTILIPHSPSAVADLGNQIRNSIITSNEVTNQMVG